MVNHGKLLCYSAFRRKQTYFSGNSFQQCCKVLASRSYTYNFRCQDAHFSTKMASWTWDISRTAISPVLGLSHRCHKLQASIHQRPYSEGTNHTISYEDLLALLESENAQLIDVREPKEVEETGTIPGATNIPLGDIPRALQLPDESFKAVYGVEKPDEQSGKTIFFCKMGPRSYSAMYAARVLGYSGALHYAGGFQEWIEKNEKPQL